MTVYAGTQKITMGRDKRQDAIDAQNALRQSGPNSYVQGVQEALADPFSPVSASRGKHGAPTIVPGDLASRNFSQPDSPGNQDSSDITTRSGNLEAEVSSTNVPHKDVENMEMDAYKQKFGTGKLGARLENMARGGQGFTGHNNRNREV